MLEEIFTPHTKRWSNPNPNISLDWFRNYISKLQQSNTVWFSDEIGYISRGFIDDMKKHPHLMKHNTDVFPFKEFIPSYFTEDNEEYKPILLPTQRTLEAKNLIQFNQSIKPSGIGLLNRLFYLKNQDIESDEYTTFLKIYKAFNEITDHKFNIIPNEANEITIYFQREGRGWIESGSCGQGLSDILVIVSFVLDFDYNFILIEEPESHVHPDMQRKLLHFLHKNTNKQFLLTTHSNIFLDSAIINKVFLSTFNDTVEIDEATSRSNILFELGYSVTDNLVSDLTILVEGPKDVPIIEEFLIKMSLHEQYDIKIWPLGGDIMDQLDLSVFAQNYNILALVDKDPGSERIRKNFLANCKEYNIPVTKLKKYAIENYFSLAALKKVFGTQIPDSITSIDPDTKLRDQIRIDVKKNNKHISQAMELDDIKDTDLFKFFVKVQKTLQNANIS
ncbi:AAA family ATPase [Chloroflexota bacterium]